MEMRTLVLACVIAVVALTVVVGQAGAQAPAPTHQPRVFGALKILGCVFGVGTFIAGNVVLVAKIRKAGGIVKFAKRLWHAKNAEQRAHIVYNTLGSLSGVTALVAACSP
jgi:hypothetical protein